MTVFNGGLRLVTGILALTLVLPAAAQEILGQGKTGAQLFASNCALCHKSPQGLTKAGGIFGLSSFLRQHYTSSRETAAAIAAYLETVDRAAPPSRTPARRGKADDKGKPAARRPEPAKPGETAPGETKSGATRSKPAETKASDSTPVEASEPAQAKPVDAKPADEKAGEPKAAPASKPD